MYTPYMVMYYYYTEELDGVREALLNQGTLKKIKGTKADKFCYDSDLQLRISDLVTNDNECLHDFFVVLAICNTVVVSKRKQEKEEPSPVSEDDKGETYNMENLSETVLSEVKKFLGHTNINAIQYEAESPDEQALVEVSSNVLQIQSTFDHFLFKIGHFQQYATLYPLHPYNDQLLLQYLIICPCNSVPYC